MTPRSILAIGSLAFALAATPSAAWAKNLLSGSLFQTNSPRARLPAGWMCSSSSAMRYEIDPVVRHGDRPAVRITADPTEVRSWHILKYPVRDLRPNTPYTISVWAKSEGLSAGAMAYIALNCFANNKRLEANDSNQKITGTKGWTRIVKTIPALPKGTSEALFVLCLYGSGTVWFAEPQVETGMKATAYAPSAEDLAQAKRIAADLHAAAAWRAAHNMDCGTPCVGILDLGLPSRKGPFGHPSDPAVFEKALAGRYRTVRLTGEEVANASIFSSDNFSLLIIPTGSAFPAAAVGNLMDFLSSGGQMFTCGGYAFDDPVCRRGGAWTALKACAAPVPAGTDPVALPAASSWGRSTSATSKTVVRDVTGPGGSVGVELSTPRMEKYNTISVQVPPLKGQSVISFLARGDATTPHAWFELAERDGSRWHAKLDLTPDWKEFRLSQAQFEYWFDNPSVGRGYTGDNVRFDNVRQLSLCVAGDVVKTGMPHAFAVCAVKAGVDPYDAERKRGQVPPINTRTARIRDAIHVRPEQIGVFDPSFELRAVAGFSLAPEMEGVFPSVGRTGPVAGLSAIAQLGVNGHGFGPNRAAWRPLLACRDASGAPRGHAGAIVHHYADTFAGSSWAFFGVDDVDIFASDGSEPSTGRAGRPRPAEALIVPVIDALLNRLYLCGTTAEYACYRVGEKATLRTRVANFGAPRAVTVRFTLADESGSTVATVERPCSADAGQAVVEADWTVPPDAPDFLTLTAELLEGKRLRDRERGAFVVWNDRVIAQGPRLKKEGLRLTIGGESRFFLGCQTFWGQHGSVTASSPLRFYEDFRQMRAFGLRWTRCFLLFRDEKEKRDSDAVVQLAQKFGIVLYHTPNLDLTRDGTRLAEEGAKMREIVTRYRDVPGLAIDIRNEPSMKEPPSRGATDAQRAWARSNRDAAKEVRPDLPVSVGWSQGWAGGRATKDPQVASLDLDFTDRHYYGPPVRMPQEVKDLDLRVLGKPLVVGECGAKNHPSFKAWDPSGHGDDDASYDARFRYLVSHAFGLGATALLSWHWRDPMEGIFPCGLVHATNVPRPTALLFSRMARTFGRLELVDNPPDVVVLMDEEARQSPSPARETAINAAHDLDDALLWWGANWSKLTSSRAADIPPSVKLVLKPEDFAVAAARRDAVGARLRAAGCAFTRRAEDSEAIETFRVPGKGATGWVFWNGGESPVEVRRSGHALTVGPKRVGYMQITDAGTLQVREEL